MTPHEYLSQSYEGVVRQTEIALGENPDQEIQKIGDLSAPVKKYHEDGAEVVASVRAEFVQAVIRQGLKNIQEALDGAKEALENKQEADHAEPRDPDFIDRRQDTWFTRLWRRWLMRNFNLDARGEGVGSQFFTGEKYVCSALAKWNLLDELQTGSLEDLGCGKFIRNGRNPFLNQGLIRLKNNTWLYRAGGVSTGVYLQELSKDGALTIGLQWSAFRPQEASDCQKMDQARIDQQITAYNSTRMIAQEAMEDEYSQQTADYFVGGIFQEGRLTPVFTSTFNESEE